MGDDNLEDRSVEVLEIPEDVDDDWLWLYFESKRSGGGNLISLDRNGDKVLLVFENIEDVAQVLSKESHIVGNAKLVVRRKPPKDKAKLVLRGISPSTSLEMVELYVENLTGIDSENYTLYQSTGKDLILIHLHEPLTEDFQKISDKVCKRKLDGAKVTLEQVECPDSILVENVPSTLTEDTLVLYFESSRGGGAEVTGVRKLAEGLIKVSFKDIKSVDCVLQRSHRLEETDLTVKPYFSFLQIEVNESAPSIQNGTNQPRDNQSSFPAQSVADSDLVSSTTSPPLTLATNQASSTQNPHALSASVTPKPHPRTKPVPQKQNFCSTPDTPKPLHNPSPVTPRGSLTTASPDSQCLWTSVTKDTMEEAAPTVLKISVPDQIKLKLIGLSNLLDDLRKVHPSFEISLMQDGVQIKGPGHLEAERLKSRLLEFLSSFSQCHVPLTGLKAKFLQKEAVKDKLLISLKDESLPCTYTMSDTVLIVTSLSFDMVNQACERIKGMLVEFRLPVEPEHECMLYCQEWITFLQSLGMSCAEVTEEGAEITVVTLKGMEEESKNTIIQFLSTPVQREAMLSLEPAMLKYIQLHHQQLLCDMQHVIMVPLETGDGLCIQGNPSACQTAMEVLSAMVSSTYTKTVTVSQPGITRFLLEKDGASILEEMMAKFQVYICLDKVHWTPLENEDIFELAWKMTSNQNFLRASSPKPGLNACDPTADDQYATAYIEEAKKILSNIDDDRSFEPSNLKISHLDEEEDLYTDFTAEQNDDSPLSPEERASLSLAIQMSMESCQNLDMYAKEDLQKALELSRGESMLVNEDHMLEKAVDLSLQEDIKMANLAEILVFASYNHDLIRVDIALGKKVGMRQCEEKLEHKSLRRLTPYHKRCVDLIKRKHAVEIQIQGATATLSGFKDYVSGALPDLKTLLKKATLDAEVLQTVEWVWHEQGSSVATPYIPEATMYIENAWRMKKEKTDILLNNQPYIINFEKMEEYSVSSGRSVPIARRIVGSEGSRANLQDEDYSLVSDLPDTSRVDEASDEFQDVVKEFYETIREYHNKIKIIKVEKLMNRLLYNQYRLKKASIEQGATCPEVERTLYHGTSETSVKEICIQGFNRSFCGKNATVYGQGVYFAVDSALSVSDTYSPPNADGHKFIFVAKVLTGDFTVGRHEMKTAPLKDNSDIPVRYHSVADKIESPTLFVIFNDTQAYPQYLITCQKVHG